MPFSLEVYRHGATSVVAPTGELDIATAPRLRRALLDAIHFDAGPTVVDLDGVSFMDSSGLAVLVAAFKRAKHEGLAFAVCRPQRAVAKVLELTHVDRVLPVLSDVEAPVPASLTLVDGG